MKYPKLDLGKIEAIVNKLGGMKGVQHFLSEKTIVASKEQIEPFNCVFASISEIQKIIQQTFKNAGIDLVLVDVCGNEELPSFRGSAINDVSGSSLDIEFKNKKGHFLTFHLFNRRSFALTLDTYESTSIYPLERFTDDDFLQGIKSFYNKYDYNSNTEVQKAAFQFRNNFRK